MRTQISERIVEEPGYRAVYRPQDDVVAAPHLAQARVGQRLRARVRVQRRRLGEAELIRQMQTCGIGRPSTYAETLAALRRRRYVDAAMSLTPRGKAVLGWARQHTPHLSSPAYTAALERALDDLAAGKNTYGQVVAAAWREIIEKE